MHQPITPALDPLDHAAREFSQWRSQKSGQPRIPEHLWNLACDAAKRHGIAKTAAALKVDYYALKKRLSPQADTKPARRRERKPDRSSQAAFVELPTLATCQSTECEVEFENGHGARLVLRWKGAGQPDLATLGQVFWSR